MSDKPYSVDVNRITQKATVSYGCPHCREPLTSPLRDAGQADDCPACGRRFAVPGAAELAELRQKVAAAKAHKAAEKERRAREAVETKQRRAEEKAAANAQPEFAQVVVVEPHEPPGTNASNGPERVVRVEHPAMIRNHPILFSVCILLGCIGVLRAILAGQLEGVALAVLVAIFFGVWYLTTLTTTLTITTRVSVLRTGLIARNTREVRHQDIRLLAVNQGVLHRLLGVGVVEIASSGHAGVEISMSGLTDPQGVKQTIDRLRT